MEKRTVYNKMGLNPHNRKFELVGKAKLLESEAELLNLDTKKTGVKYEKAARTTAKK